MKTSKISEHLITASVIPLGTSVLGIDPSLTKTGMAHIDGDDLLTWRLTPVPKGPERLIEFRDEISDTLHRVKPEVTCVEGYSYQSKFGTHQAGELGGIIRVVLYEYGRPFYVVPPDKMKKFITGKGKGGKAPIMMHLLKRWGVEIDQEDEADAAAFAIMAAAALRPTGLTKYQVEALESLENEASPVRTRTRRV